MNLFSIDNIKEKNDIERYTNNQIIKRFKSIKYSLKEKYIIRLVYKKIKKSASNGKYSYKYYYHNYSNKEISNVIYFFKEKGYNIWRDRNIWTGEKWLYISWKD